MSSLQKKTMEQNNSKLETMEISDIKVLTQDVDLKYGNIWIQSDVKRQWIMFQVFL